MAKTAIVSEGTHMLSGHQFEICCVYYENIMFYDYHGKRYFIKGSDLLQAIGNISLYLSTQTKSVLGHGSRPLSTNQRE